MSQTLERVALLGGDATTLALCTRALANYDLIIFGEDVLQEDLTEKYPLRLAIVASTFAGWDGLVSTMLESDAGPRAVILIMAEGQGEAVRWAQGNPDRLHFYEGAVKAEPFCRMLADVLDEGREDEEFQRCLAEATRPEVPDSAPASPFKLLRENEKLKG